MAKKKTAKPAAEPSGKVRVELRFDQDVFDGIRRLAETSGISVNQLMHGLARWSVKNGHSGEGYEEGGVIKLRQQLGCVFFGTLVQYWENSAEKAEYENLYEERLGDFKNPGKNIFQLDFTERHVIQESSLSDSKRKGRKR